MSKTGTKSPLVEIESKLELQIAIRKCTCTPINQHCKKIDVAFTNNDIERL